MKPIRIIARLDIKGPNLVKGIHLEGLRVLGNPIDFARYYYEDGADEIIYCDVVASLYQRNGLLELLKETAKSVYIPITVSGGIQKLSDISDALKAGADKVCINTFAINHPEFIVEAVKRFGSSTIVVAIEVLRMEDGRLMAFTENGRQNAGIDAVTWAQQVEALGAGEILLTSINQEGTGNGFDGDLMTRITQAVSIPVVVHGGAGSAHHVKDAIRNAEIDGVALASIFHYNYINLFKNFQSTEGNFDFLKSGRRFSKIAETSIQDLKAYLAQEGIVCRVMN